MRRATLGILLLAVVAGCGTDPYPLLTPAGASDWAPTALGKPVELVVLYLQPRPGDRLDLVSAEALGVGPGADTAVYFAPPVVGPAGTTIGDALEPVAGAVVTIDRNASPGPGNDVGLVVEVTPRVAGTYTVTAVRVSFRLNGGQVQTKEGLSQNFTVCASDPAPTGCGPSPPG